MDRDVPVPSWGGRADLWSLLAAVCAASPCLRTEGDMVATCFWHQRIGGEWRIPPHWTGLESKEGVRGDWLDV